MRRTARRSKAGVHNVIYIEGRLNYDCKRGIKKKESKGKYLGTFVKTFSSQVLLKLKFLGKNFMITISCDKNKKLVLELLAFN